MKNVFIIGSRGYHYNYGGWETFVSNLVDNYDDSNTNFYISELSQDKFKEYDVNKNIKVTAFNVKLNGGFKMLICTIKAFYYYLKYIKTNRITNCYIYVLGLKLGPFLKLERRRMKRLGIRVFVNPDGLEHERAKWNYPVKKFFLLSEKWMLNSCDVIICDAKGIKKYIDVKYPKLKKRTLYIAYGTNAVDLSDVSESDILKEYHLHKNKYFLMVGRFVPENNYELVIREYLKANTDKELVIVSNISNSSYYKELYNKLNLLNNKKIIFIDGVYDQKKLAVIRKNAFAYIHGHSVGGTNPSLLEALSLTNLNILYDVCFNKDIGGNSCLYFSEKKSLSKIINNIDNYDIKKMGRECKTVINDYFTWKIIVSKYKELFR